MTRHSAKLPIWQDYPEWSALPPRLREAAEPLTAAAGKTLFRAGSRPLAIYYVLDGEVRLVRRSASGAESILQRARRGPLAEASLYSPRYHCDAVVCSSARLLRFPRPLFLQTIDDDPAFRTAWITHLASEVRRARAQSERLSLKRAADRVLHYIECEGRDGVLRLEQTRKDWAAELGLSHEALYRTLATLQRQGRLHISGQTFEVQPPTTALQRGEKT